MRSSPIVVVAYDPAWPALFEQLCAGLWPALRDLASAIEHVGSTSVPGLAAKPVIDMDIVVPGPAAMAQVIERLGHLGYQHRGNLGIDGREAFQHPPGLPAHHLYACVVDGVALANHLAVRDYLRAHPATAERYGRLKMQLADAFPHDIDAYVAGKTDMLLDILRESGFPTSQLDEIAQANRL
ncbi:GrpB family protein [Uliginosibacterium sp. H1]|uniref:GrpB family protein n=1 Tax=Uliginosibacterium sp. H1 TaxID=3114757 RepID=UPI002E177F56|nr:GrpB family protein [Uliginosibacterium sp. H1]